jgi:hypothetical protein
MEVVSPDYYVSRIIRTVGGDGYIKSRESSLLEFKESFNLGNMDEYAKTMAAFANNRGGIIIFGVKDNPRIPIGIRKEKFDNIKQEKVTGYLIEHFSPEIKWDIGITGVDGKYFGYIFVLEAYNKPIICKKNNGDLKSGEIYYRYRGQSRKIEFSELRKIIDEIRESEKRLWMKHIEKIAQIGPQNIAFIDLMRGSIETQKLNGSKLIIDRSLLDDLREKVKFVEEGKFSEKEGFPTLKLIGEVQASDNVIIPNLDLNKDYPYIQKQLAEELGIRPHDVHVLIWKYGLKKDRKYSISIQTSKSTRVYKYTKYALEFLKEKLEENKDNKSFLKQLSKEFQSSSKYRDIIELEHSERDSVS